MSNVPTQTFTFTVSEEDWKDLSTIPGVDVIDELEDQVRTKFISWLSAWRKLEAAKRDGEIAGYKIDGDTVYVVPKSTVKFIPITNLKNPE